MKDKPFSYALLKPQHWPSWLGVGCWYLLSQLPYKWQMAMARKLAPLLFKNKKRIGYARTNLRACFPDMGEAEREQLLKKNAESMAMAMFETGIGWFWSKKRLAKLYRIRGFEHVQKAQEDGVGVLLLTMHFSTLDIGGAFFGLNMDFDGFYRPHSNPVYDYLQRKGRLNYCNDGIVIPRDSVRTMIGRLRQGRAVWYAPDRDMGYRNSVFVDFFGVSTAMIVATSKIVQIGRARVIPFTQTRMDDDSGYELVIHEPFDNFPSGDDKADTQRIAHFMEREIAKCPEQYFWAQPRFKTRPEGEGDFYE